MVISIAGLTQAGDLYKPKGLKITYSFSEDGKEVNIDEPNLPEPWMNRLTNDVFHTWIT